MSAWHTVPQHTLPMSMDVVVSHYCYHHGSLKINISINSWKSSQTSVNTPNRGPNNSCTASAYDTTCPTAPCVPNKIAQMKCRSSKAHARPQLQECHYRKPVYCEPCIVDGCIKKILYWFKLNSSVYLPRSSPEYSAQREQKHMVIMPRPMPRLATICGMKVLVQVKSWLSFYNFNVLTKHTFGSPNTPVPIISPTITIAPWSHVERFLASVSDSSPDNCTLPRCALHFEHDANTHPCIGIGFRPFWNSRIPFLHTALFEPSFYVR